MGLSLQKKDEIAPHRELVDFRWPDVEKLQAFREALISDYRKLIRLKAYLENHDTKLPFTYSNPDCEHRQQCELKYGVSSNGFAMG